MAVERIEEYRMQNGEDILKVYCKPTKKFPEGKNYFYTDNNSITRALLTNYTWFIAQEKDKLCVRAIKHITLDSTYTYRTTTYFHKEYAFEVLGYYPDCTDHIDGLAIDNRDYNLNIVNQKQNCRNRQSKGYVFEQRDNYFTAFIFINNVRILKRCNTEYNILHLVYSLRKYYYKDYDYNFLLDRRDDLDLLDAELTGKISSEEATYRHVKRYVESNCWYVYRYGLEDYCKEHHIPIPSYSLDSQGFMIHPVTGQKLCPFK